MNRFYLDISVNKYNKCSIQGLSKHSPVNKYYRQIQYLPLFSDQFVCIITFA